MIINISKVGDNIAAILDSNLEVPQNNIFTQWLGGKESAMQETQVQSLGREDSLE